MKTVCVIGNFSGRNTGDNAILENLLADVSERYPKTRFTIPSINKNFIHNNYSRFPIEAVPLMPWNLSLKIFGLPVFRAILKSNLVLVTDAILFDHKFWNPVFNYLSTLWMAFPVAHRRQIPIVLYNGSVGPIKKSIGRRALEEVIRCMDMVIVRDPESIAILKKLHIEHEQIILGADCALNTPIPNTGRLQEIFQKEGLFSNGKRTLSVNVNSYIDSFLSKGKEAFGAERFKHLITETLDRVVKDLDVNLVFVMTQVMDIKIGHEILHRMKARDRVRIITNRDYSHNEIAGVLAHVDLHVGMRTHSVILATASCTPTICIAYRPKNKGYMQTIEESDRLVEFDHLKDSNYLYQLICKTFSERQNIRRKLEPIIAREKEKAKKSAEYLGKYLG
ncbi:MAG: polysaccharide pyruvyl transferase family protein [Syntrophorhabdus sp.]